MLATGAVIGGVAGATAVAMLDIVARGGAGAWLGFLGAAAVGAGIETADLLHHSKLIHVAERPVFDSRVSKFLNGHAK